VRAFRKSISCVADKVGGVRHELIIFCRGRDPVELSHFVPHGERSLSSDEHVLGTLLEHHERHVQRALKQAQRMPQIVMGVLLLVVGFLVGLSVLA